MTTLSDSAASNDIERSIISAAWRLLYTYLDGHRTESFGRIGWKFIRFDVTGERLLDILTPLFDGVPTA
jgi:hypothetical protein